MTTRPHAINLSIIAEQSQRLKMTVRAKAPVPKDRYLFRVTNLKTSPFHDNRGEHATLTIAEGPHSGQQFETHLYGRPLEWATKALENDSLCEAEVYVRVLDDGREFSNVNAATLQPARELPDQPIAEPRIDMEERVLRAVAGEGNFDAASRSQPIPCLPIHANDDSATFCLGFWIVGSTAQPRERVHWFEHLSAAATCTPPALIGTPMFLSTYTFPREFALHMEAHNGSTAGYSGMVHSPFLVFEIDGDPDLAAAQKPARLLLGALISIGVPRDSILIFFSGGRGFHILIPSTLAGARPSHLFAKAAGVFCVTLAGTVQCKLDESMYRTLQPLRAPNSRHEGSGLFKIVLSADELVNMTVDEIRTLALTPRPFELPAIDWQPMPLLIALWAFAVTESTRSEAGPQNPRPTHGKGNTQFGDCRIFQNTWTLLINGVDEGRRADEIHKAAANLADFETRDHLIHALLTRAVELSGFPPEEAAKHIDSAINRANQRHGSE
jgi:hypothetical protein